MIIIWRCNVDSIQQQLLDLAWIGLAWLNASDLFKNVKFVHKKIMQKSQQRFALNERWALRIIFFPLFLMSHFML